jgi:hypothetical protein
MTKETANRPPDWALDMARVPFNPMAEVRAANFAHSPCGMLPKDLSVSQQISSAPRNTTGWIDRPMVNPDNPQHPTPGINHVDRLLDAADHAERKEASTPDDMMTKMAAAMTAVLQMQSQTLAILAQLTDKADQPKSGGNK